MLVPISSFRMKLKPNIDEALFMDPYEMSSTAVAMSESIWLGIDTESSDSTLISLPCLSLKSLIFTISLSLSLLMETSSGFLNFS